jgi:hypothetical protein
MGGLYGLAKRKSAAEAAPQKQQLGCGYLMPSGRASDPHECPELKKSSAWARERKTFHAPERSHYRETADRRSRFIAPIRAGSH